MNLIKFKIFKDMKKILIIPILFLIILTGCFKERIIGSGTTTSEKRNVGGTFTEIRIEGSANVKVKQGDSIEVIAKDFPNLLPYLRTTVSGNTLVIDFQSDTWISNSVAEVTVTLPKLTGLEISGSGDIGSLNNLTCEDLGILISGSGDISLAGKGKKMNAKISGSGDVRTFDFICDDIKANVTGSGDMDLNAVKTLDAAISGSGDITYKGNPSVNSQVTGSGRVRKF
jgi:Putative auto-transporter adhesin, head GIN domain